MSHLDQPCMFWDSKLVECDCKVGSGIEASWGTIVDTNFASKRRLILTEADLTVLAIVTYSLQCIHRSIVNSANLSQAQSLHHHLCSPPWALLPNKRKNITE